MDEYIDIKKYIKNENLSECTEVGEYIEDYSCFEINYKNKSKKIEE